MDNIIIEESGFLKLLDLVHGAVIRNTLKYWYKGMSFKEIAKLCNLNEAVITSEILIIEKLAKDNLIPITCKQCGKVFYVANHRLRLCPNCKEENLKKRNEAISQNNKTTVEPKKKKQKGITDVHEIVRRMVRYNKANGTSLSYGKYVLKVGE